MTIAELFKKLSGYPSNTRLDFMLVDHPLSDSQHDIPVKPIGIIGSGDTVEDCDVKYIEIGLIKEITQ